MNYLCDLAKTIGWKLVNEDEGFSVYEYIQNQNKFEEVSRIVKIYDNPTEIALYDMIQVLKGVLPRKLSKKINKILKNIKISDLPNTIEVVKFTVEEYISGTDFVKMGEYAKLLGVDINELGYSFKYELTKKEVREIIAKIETSLPIELAPILGRIKKIDYKLAYIKKYNSSHQDIE